MPLMVNNARFYSKHRFFPDTFTFLYVGRLIKGKGVEQLIKQFNRNFASKNSNLRIVGSGDQEYYLKNKYESEKVIFLGKKLNDDLVQELHTASCLVCPSDFEPWGLVVNEALSSGLPVVTTKEVGANYDLIKGKNTGMIASNINEFGDKMLELYYNANLLVEYSNNASVLMRDFWNYDLYNKCLQYAIKRVRKWG